MSDLPIDLNNLGTQGVTITTGAANNAVGFAVSAAGDLNGDGIADFAVAAPGSTQGYVGAVYIVYGTAAGFDFTLDLSALDGTDGFRLHYQNNVYINFGTSLAALGDINGDGVDDLGIGTGTAGGYVLFGRGPTEPAFGADTDIAPLVTAVDAIRIVSTGWNVASAGDLNDDGIDDVLLSSNGGGTAHVLFGRAAGFATSAIFANSLATTGEGFTITGASNFLFGEAIAGGGDVNGDGIDDLVIGASLTDLGAESGHGASYVLFGKNTALDGAFANLNVSTLNGANGFQLRGMSYDRAGYALAIGDFNADGIDDLAIGAPRVAGDPTILGRTYVVFGKDNAVDPWGGSFELASLDGSNGFVILRTTEQGTGSTSLGVGDVNGDGIEDLLMGGDGPNYIGGYGQVLFGRAGAFAASISAADLHGSVGLTISVGVGDGDDNLGVAVAIVGDINADGVADYMVGASRDSSVAANAGAAYLIYGVAMPINYVGGLGDDTRDGGALGDSLAGGGGKDILNGLAGDDSLDGGDANDQLFGGDGVDELIGGLGGDILYGDAGADDLSGGDGADKLFGGTGADLLNGGTGNDRMDGESDIDTLNGGAGNDFLDGGLGADIMRGGADNDVYIVDDAGDQTIELAGGGYDVVRTSLSWTLASEVEALELQSTGDADGTGNALANNLQGNSGNNILSGLAGNDTINGNDGDDIIIGGQGGDLLRGGLGADIFRVEHAFGGGLETDQIYDFSAAEGDIMDFSALFAGTIAKVATFNNTAGQMTLTFGGGQTTVKLDIDGNGTAEYWARINGDVTGDWEGWLL